MNLQSTYSRFVIAACLTLLGLLGNYASYSLFFGVDFLFGSIAVLLSIRLLGTTFGTAIAVIVGSYTVYLWGHPYALIIFTLEALVVGLLQQTRLRGLVLSDICYWAFIGVPLGALFYSQFIGLDNTQTLFIILKQPVNGVFNAIIATFLLILLGQRLPQIFTSGLARISSRELMFTMIISGVFISTLAIVVYQSRVELEKLENHLTEQLELRGNIVRDHIKAQGIPDTPSTLKRISGITEQGSAEICLVTPRREIVLNTDAVRPAHNFFTTGKAISRSAKLSQWLPPRNDTAHMLWWRSSVYFIKVPVDAKGIGNIVISSSAATVIDKLHALHTETLLLLIVITLVAVVAAQFISHVFTQPLVRLSTVSRDLPEKLVKRIAVNWPNSQLEEIEQLNNNIQHMANQLATTLQGLQDAKHHLEQRVEERTIELKNLSAHNTALIENAADGIITIDKDNNILSINPAAEKMFGCQNKEVFGASLFSFLEAKDTDGNLPDIPNNLGNTLELNGKRHNDALFPVELLAALVPVNDEVIYACFIRDISERQKIEKLKNDFISTVSHELRTPLTAIMGAIKLIQGTHAGQLDAAGRNLIDISVNNIERLMRIINDLLDVQKIIQNGGMSFYLNSVEVMPLVKRIIDENTAYAQRFNASLELTEMAHGCYVLADGDRLAQAITNLISNAAKFSPDGGVIRVAVRKLDDHVRITISDEGEGIPDDFQHQIFEKFTQADSDSTRLNGGTGLGLSITRSIVERLGGNIWFDSNEQGTHFHIQLSLHEQ